MSVYGTPAVKIILNTTDPSGSFILNQYAGPQTGNFWVTGKGRVDTRLGIGGLDPAYALHVATVDPISASFSGRVIGADAVNPNEFITKAQMESAIAVGATLLATQVGYGSATNTLTGSGAITFNAGLGKLTLNTATGRLIQLGNAAPVASPNPVQIHMGGSYSSTAGAGLKLVIYDNNIGGILGFGSSNGSFDYVSSGLAPHKFYLDATPIFGIGPSQISVLNSLQIVWEDVLGPKMAFYGGAAGGNAGYNVGVASGGILYTNVPTGGKHALRINGVDAFTISGAGATITTVANDDTKSALMVWDATDKLVRWRSVASVTTGFLTAITADNGLTANTVSNVRLGSTISGGSPLLYNTFINTGSFYLKVEGTGGAALFVQNTAGGTGAYVQSQGGTSLIAEGGTVGINTSGTTTGISVGSAGGLPLWVVSDTATTGDIKQAILIQRNTSLVAGTGFGLSIDFGLEDATSQGFSNQIISKWMDATHISRTSMMLFTGVKDGAFVDLLSLEGTGVARLHKYGLGLITGAAAYNLAVDGSGKIIEVATTPTTAPPHNLLGATHADTVTGAPVLGAMIVGNGTPAWDRLLGHTVAAKRFLTQTGTGVVSAIPVWSAIGFADLPDLSTTYVPVTRILTINGSAQDLTANRTWTITTTGTVNRITVTGGAGLTPTIDIAATYVGQASITTVGTITTGTWNGSVIGPTFGGTGITTYTLGDTLYASATNVLSKLPGNITTGKLFLSQTGTGTVSAAPVWSAMAGSDITGAALTKTDDTNVTLTLGGTPATALLRAASIAVGWAGTLAVTRGGTGLATAAQGDILYASAANTYSLLNKSVATNMFLKNSGPSNNPAWSAITAADIGIGAALTKVDDTNVTLTLTGTPSSALLIAAGITVGWAGSLAPGRGGTGITTYILGDTLYASAANVLSKLSGNITAVKQFLSQTGTGAVSAAPVWAAITLADIGTMATARILGRVTAGTGVVEQLTGTQATTLMDLFSTTTTTKGVVPGSNNVGSTFFLRADGTWAVPPGSGGGGYTTLSQFVDETAWRMYYSNAAGDITPFALGTANQVLQSTGVSAAPTWVTIGSGTIGGSLAATQVAYGSAANTITGSANFIFTNATGTLTLNTTTGKLIQLGDLTALATTTPASINMGASRSTTAGAYPKLLLYDDAVSVLGFGVSTAELNYIIPSGCSHGFYIGGVLMMGVLETYVGIKANNYLAFGNSLTEKIRLYDGGSTAANSGIGMGTSWVYYNVAPTGSHRFTIGSTSVFEVASSTGYTTRTAVQSLTDIGSLIILPASYSSNAIEIRNSGGVTFQIDVNGSVTTSSSVYATRLGIDKSGSNLPGVWLGENVATATPYNFSLLRSGLYTQLNATGAGGRILFSRDNAVAGNNIMFFTENHTLAIGWLYSTPIAEVSRMLNVANGGDPSLVIPGMRLFRWTNPSAPTAGVTGGGIEFLMNTQGGGVNIEIGSVIASVVTNIGIGTEAFDFVVYNMTGGATATESFRSKSTGEIAVQNLTQNDALTKVAVWDDTSKLIKWRAASTIGGGIGTIMGSLAATQVAYGSAANTITGSNDFNFVTGKLTLSKTTGTNLQLGDLVSLGTTTPVNINLGASYSTVAGANPKLIIHSDGYGIGISAAGTAMQEYLVPAGVWHRFYVGGVWKFHVDSAIIAVPNDVRISLQQGFGERITMYEAGGVTAGNYCFGVDSGTLWYNVSTGGKHDMRVNAVSIFQVHGSGATSPGTGVESERLGLNSNAAGGYSTAFGRGATTAAGGNYQVAVGYGASATGDQSIAIGNCTAGHVGVSIGTGAVSGSTGITIGSASGSSADSAISIGYNSHGNGTQSIAIGAYPTANGLASIAMGTGAVTAGSMSMAFGYNANSSYDYSVVIGRDIASTAGNQFVIGSLYSTFYNIIGGNGVTNAAPASFYINPTSASGTDIAGSTMFLRGSAGTGAAVPGTIAMQTSDPTVSGTTAQVHSTKLTVGQYGIQPYMYYSSAHPTSGAAGYMLYNNYYNAMALHNGTQWNWMLTSGNTTGGLSTAMQGVNGVKLMWNPYSLIWQLLLGENFSWSGEPGIGSAALVTNRYLQTNGYTFGFGQDETRVFASYGAAYGGFTLGHTPYVPPAPVLRVGAFNFLTGAKGDWYNSFGEGITSKLVHFYSPPVINTSTGEMTQILMETDTISGTANAYDTAVTQMAIDIVMKSRLDISLAGSGYTPKDWIGIRINSIAMGPTIPQSRHYAVQSLMGRNYMADGIEFGSKTVDTTYLANVGTMIYRSDTGKFRGYNGTVWKNIAYETGNGVWKVFYTDAAGTTTELAIGAAGLVLTSNGAAAAPSWITPPGGGGGGTPGLPDTSVQYNAAGSFAGSAQMTFASGTLTLGKTSGKNLQLGTLTALTTATPVQLSLGGTYSNANGTNLKLLLYDDGGGAPHGFGISTNQMDYVLGAGGGGTVSHSFYLGSTRAMGIYDYAIGCYVDIILDVNKRLSFNPAVGTKIEFYGIGGGYSMGIASATLYLNVGAGSKISFQSNAVELLSVGFSNTVSIATIPNATAIGHLIIPYAGQTANVLEVRPGGVIAAIDANGGGFFNTLKVTTVAQDDTQTKVMVWDSATGVVKYRASSTLGGAGGSTKFGKAGEDVVAAENRLFTTTGFNFDIENTAAGSNHIRHALDTGAGYLDHSLDSDAIWNDAYHSSLNSYMEVVANSTETSARIFSMNSGAANLPSAFITLTPGRTVIESYDYGYGDYDTFAEFVGGAAAGQQIFMFVTNTVAAQTTEFKINHNAVTYDTDVAAGMNFFIKKLPEAVGTKTLRYDPSTGKITYHDIPTGGGSPPTAPAGATTEVQYNNAGAFGASSQFTFASGQLTLNKNGGTNIQLGTITSAPSTDPVRIRMGASHSSVAGANPKIILYEDGTYLLGLGISSSQMDYIVPSIMSHNFYVGATKMFSVDSTNISIYGTIGVASIAQDDTQVGILTWNSVDKIVRWRAASTLGGGSVTLTATQVAFGSGTNTVTSDANMTYVSGTLKLNKTQGQNLTLGNTTGVQSTTPVSINLGASSSSAPGSNLKILLYDDGSLKAGFGISANGSDYVAYIHTFYTIDAIQRAHINDTQMGFLGSMQIGWENNYVQKMNFYGFPNGGANGHNMGVDAQGLWWNVPTAAKHILRVQGVEAFTISTIGATIATVAQDDTKTAVLVWDATDKIVRWRAASTLAGTGGGGTVTSFAFTNGNGFTGVVTTPTVTPTLTISTSLTLGSVPFIGAAGALLQDNALFFWDDTNKRLGIGTNAPTQRLQVNGTAYLLNQFTSGTQGGFAAFLNNIVTIPAGLTFSGGYTWAGGASSNNIIFAGSTTIANGATVAGHASISRIEFSAPGAIIVMTQSTGFRAIAGLQILSQTAGANAGSISHGASLLIQGVYPANATVINFTNYYGILINQLDEWGVVTFGTKWAIYQQGANDPSYFGGRIQINNVTSQGAYMLQVTGGFYVNATAATMRFAGLGTDNTATQVLAKNTSGDNVWRDVASMNKPRVGTTATSSSLTIDSDANDMYTVTALSGTMTINNPSGTPVNGQKLMLRIKGDATIRTLSWTGSQWRAGEAPLPVATIANKTMYLGFIWNSADTKWDFISYLDNF